MSPLSPRSRRWLQVTLGLALTGVGLAVAFRRVDLAAVGAALGGARWGWFGTAIGATVLAIVVRAWRWQVLLRPIETLEVGTLFSATMIGYFGNSVLPMRLGELMRAAAVARRSALMDASTALGSVAVERLLDVAGALAVALLVVPFAGDRGQGGVVAWSGAAALVAAGFGGLLWASRSARVRALLRRQTGSSGGGRAGALVRSFLRGLLLLGEGPALVPIGVSTVLIWALYAATVDTAARAVGIPLEPIETGLVLVATTVAVSVPAAPGYVGTYHAAVVLVTADLLGRPAASAQAFAVLAHAASWLPVVTIGAVCLLRSSIRPGELAALRDDQAAPPGNGSGSPPTAAAGP